MKVIMAKGGSGAKDNDAFRIEEQPVPEPGENDVLVKVAAIGMNPVDTKVRMREERDLVLGWDSYGTVEKIGSAVSGFKPGDTVYYAGDITKPGCNSEYHLVDYRIAAIAPQKLPAQEAVAMPLTSITAWEGLFVRMGFAPEKGANSGKSVLIIGGAGGVGSVAIQLAHWAGLTVYATASRPETEEWCKKLGADFILNHRQNLFDELKAAGAQSVDAIFCTTQMERHWNAMADCIAPQGRIVLIDDPEGTPDIKLFKLKSVSLCWELMYTRSIFQTADMAEQGKLLAQVADLLDDGTLVTTCQKTFNGLSVENIQAMHIKQESGTMIGKQVLIL